MTAAEIEAFLDEHFPQAKGFARIVRLGDEVELALDPAEAHLRPGGTTSGPTLMKLADTAVYFLLLHKLGPVALAVTTSLQMNFLRRPPPTLLVATARLLKLGRRLAVGEVHIRDTAGELVAQATATYSIPPDVRPPTTLDAPPARTGSRDGR
jgi:uncharacterized protein (TIGR00369 family)